MNQTEEDWVLEEAKFHSRSRQLALESCKVLARQILRLNPEFLKCFNQLKQLSREYGFKIDFYADKIVVDGEEIKNES